MKSSWVVVKLDKGIWMNAPEFRVLHVHDKFFVISERQEEFYVCWRCGERIAVADLGASCQQPSEEGVSKT